MVRIQQLQDAADGSIKWQVICEDEAGNVVTDFKSSSADAVVRFALVAIQAARQFKEPAADVTAAVMRLSERAPGQHISAQVHQREIVKTKNAANLVRGINRVGSRMPKIASIRPMTFGERMTQRRLDLNMTQVDVASRVTIISKTGCKKDAKRQLSRNAYCMYELDEAEPSLSTLLQIANALNVSPAWLAFGGE